MSSFQVQQWLRQGIAAAKAGESKRAYELLLRVVDVDEFNEQAWLWLSSVVESDADREVCLENVLAINPDNKLAKTGLVHLHSRIKSAPEIEEEAEPPIQPDMPAAPAEDWLDTIEEAWWTQPETEREVETVPEPAASTVATDLEETPAGAPVTSEPAPEVHPPGTLLQRLVIPLLLGCGLLAAISGFLILRQSDLFDPEKREYLGVMRPLLAEHEAWWDGPYGGLLEEIYRPCGPEAGGWRNYDVLVACSKHPSIDCPKLVSHCGSDIDGMQRRVERLAQQAQRAGEELLSAFQAVSVPEEVEKVHHQFLTCLDTRVSETGRVRKLAQGETLDVPTYAPACEMFPSNEMDLRAYVGGR
jgi:hypothetical protein